MPRFSIDGLGLMLLSYFTMASLSLMLIVIYSELAGRKPRLSVEACATYAAAGYGFLAAWGTCRPIAGRILFPTNLQIVHWVVAVSHLEHVVPGSIVTEGLERAWFALSWMPRAMAADGIALFGWLTLCAFLFEMWRGQVDWRGARSLS